MPVSKHRKKPTPKPRRKPDRDPLMVFTYEHRLKRDGSLDEYGLDEEERIQLQTMWFIDKARHDGVATGYVRVLTSHYNAVRQTVVEAINEQIVEDARAVLMSEAIDGRTVNKIHRLGLVRGWHRNPA